MTTEIPLPDRRDLIRSLRSDTCPMCGKWKRTAQTMCPRDYRKLNVVQRQNLYNRIGEGYEEAVKEAMGVLKKTEFILPKESR